MLDLEEKIMKQIQNLLTNEGFQVSAYTNRYGKTTYYMHENFKIQVIGSLHVELDGSLVDVNLEFDDVGKISRKYQLKKRQDSISIFSDIEDMCIKFKNYLPKIETLIEVDTVKSLNEIYDSFTERFEYPDIPAPALYISLTEMLQSGKDADNLDLSSKKRERLKEHKEWLNDYQKAFDVVKARENDII